tara:strand:- start:4 stop:213 length:210 start_codon:yes stop_codon:yes gene_type:complete
LAFFCQSFQSGLDPGPHLVWQCGKLAAGFLFDLNSIGHWLKSQALFNLAQGHRLFSSSLRFSPGFVDGL